MLTILRSFIILLVISSSIPIYSSEEVIELIKKFNLRPLEAVDKRSEKLFNLGKELFFEERLSGNKNISCGSCHSPSHFSGDALALGVGEGATFFPKFKLGKGQILKRHTPHLINIGRDLNTHYFWDGRVSRNRKTKAYNTPAKVLNGKNPEGQNIIDALSGVLAAQALFPLLSHDEMLGQVGSNSIADQPTDLKKWQSIVDRLFNDTEKGSFYKKQFKMAFPKNDNLSSFNIGHFATAIAEFERFFFQSYETPYDHFLKGNRKAMDKNSLKGMIVFFSKGQCFKCHRGPHLSNFQSFSSGAPQIGLIDNLDDKGRYNVTKRGRDKYKFKIPSLRNIALTGPYMHTGSLETLEEVVEHYNHPKRSLSRYRISDKLQSIYKQDLF